MIFKSNTVLNLEFEMNTEKPRRPPPPTPKPGQVKVYKALYDYNASRPEELSFKEGDTIYIIDMISDKNWYKAKSSDEKTGWVPSNYSILITIYKYFHIPAVNNFKLS